MTNLLTLMRRPLRRFAGDEGGSVVAEAVIVLPLFLWAYLALFVYWDSFRSMNTVQKASYTVSDMISREQDDIQESYIDGMKTLVEYLIDRDQDVRMRVTSVTWSDANQRFEVHWSRSPGNTMTPLTNTTLQNYAYEIPKLLSGDYDVIVEVDVDYNPTFDIGLPDQTFHEFIVTRPRFLPCITLGSNDTCPVS